MNKSFKMWTLSSPLGTGLGKLVIRTRSLPPFVVLNILLLLDDTQPVASLMNWTPVKLPNINRIPLRPVVSTVCCFEDYSVGMYHPTGIGANEVEIVKICVIVKSSWLSYAMNMTVQIIVHHRKWKCMQWRLSLKLLQQFRLKNSSFS